MMLFKRVSIRKLKTRTWCVATGKGFGILDLSRPVRPVWRWQDHGLYVYLIERD